MHSKRTPEKQKIVTVVIIIAIITVVEDGCLLGCYTIR
jgi:hypothetical protein